MSVIFQTLKKLEQDAFGRPGSPSKKARGGRPGFLRRFSGTPLGMGLLLFGIFAGGGILLFSLNQLSAPYLAANKTTEMKHPIRAKDSASSQPETQREQVQTNNGQADINQPVSKTALIDLEGGAANVSQTVFEPPSFSKRERINSSAPATVQFTSPANRAVDAGTGEEDAIAANTSTIPLERTHSNSGGSDLRSNEAKSPNERSMQEIIILEDDREVGREKAAENKTSTPITEAMTPGQKEQLENWDKLQQASRKRAMISKLITDLEAAFEQMDAPKVNKTLQQLTAVKGHENLFVLNLKAFWFLKQAFYDRAEEVLIKILAMDPDHLEAGINMAIVEARTERRSLALKRLMRLREHHPDNTTLTDMIRKLQ